VKFNSAFSPEGASIGNIAAIPDSLTSTVRPFSMPHVWDLILNRPQFLTGTGDGGRLDARGL
jgi:hypothetical protein